MITPQEEISRIYTEACKNGDIDSLVAFYKNFNNQKKNNKIFSLFLSIGKLFVPEISKPEISSIEREGFYLACENGHENLVDYLLTIIKDKDTITCGCFDAIEKSHFVIADKLIPFISRDRVFLVGAYNSFNLMCSLGNLNGITYLLTNTNLNLDHLVGGILNNALDEFNAPHQGFINACEHDHINIVKFIIESPDLKEHIILDYVNEGILINNIELLRYFILDLNLDENNTFINKIICDDNDLIPNLYEKKELFLNLNNELKNQEELPKKRMKI